MSSTTEIPDQMPSPSPTSQQNSPKNDEEDEVDPPVEFCALSSRSLQRPSDHYIPPPRRSHIASRFLRDPLTTALTQFSKVTSYVLNPYDDYEGPSLFDIRNTLRDPLGYVRHREENAHYGHQADSGGEPISHPPPALPQIDCSVPQQRLPPLTEDEYNEKFFNVSRKTLLDRIFKGGIASHSLRRQLWPIVLGITEKNDDFDWSLLTSHYHYYANQWKTIIPDQESRFTAYRERKSLIDRDVVRCDRTHFFYSDSTCNLEKLRHLLMTYIMYDFDTGYVQGMTDLAAPLLYVWDGDIPKAFWCFVQMMNLFKRNFEMSQKTIGNQLKALLKLIRITDPVFAQYLRNNDSGNCYFAFRWIICLFKREFMKRKTDDYDDVLIVWETIWSVHALASYNEDKEEVYVDRNVESILTQINKSQKRMSSWNDSDYIFKTSSTESSTTSLQANVPTPCPIPSSTDSFNGVAHEVGIATLKNSPEPFDLYLNRSKDASFTASKSSDKNGDHCDTDVDDEVDRPRPRRQLKSPPPQPLVGDLITTASSTIPTTTATITTTMLTSPTPINKTKSILINPPPKPRPVLSSSPRQIAPGGGVFSYALSPPVREMYLNLMANNDSDFMMCSPSSVGSKGSKGSSIEEIKRLTPVGNHPGGAVPVPISQSNQHGKTETTDTSGKQLDSSDELKLYEFDQLTIESASRQAKLENFELFCLCISLAIIRRERDIILIKKYEASEILKHFNTLTLNEYLDSILLHSMTIWHWLKHDGGEKSLYSDDDKPSNTSNDDFDLLNDDDVGDCHFAALSV